MFCPLPAVSGQGWPEKAAGTRTARLGRLRQKFNAFSGHLEFLISVAWNDPPHICANNREIDFRI